MDFKPRKESLVADYRTRLSLHNPLSHGKGVKSALYPWCMRIKTLFKFYKNTILHLENRKTSACRITALIKANIADGGFNRF
jgi:hypothetical protein